MPILKDKTNQIEKLSQVFSFKLADKLETDAISTEKAVILIAEFLLLINSSSQNEEIKIFIDNI
jgi:hypothetical protein